jgi:hypothetical protein
MENGNEWNVVADLFNGRFPKRSPSRIRARWDKQLNPSLIKGAFTAEEDAEIINFVQKNGAQEWQKTTKILPGRSPKQCRERWFNHLDPSVNKAPWTDQEDTFIFDSVMKLGPKWSIIAKMMPGRTDNSIKNRWNSSLIKRVQHRAGQKVLGAERPPKRRGRKCRKRVRKPSEVKAVPQEPNDVDPLEDLELDDDDDPTWNLFCKDDDFFTLDFFEDALQTTTWPYRTAADPIDPVFPWRTLETEQQL